MERIHNQSFTITFTNMETLWTSTDTYTTADEVTAEFWRLMPLYVSQDMRVNITEHTIDGLRCVTARITERSDGGEYRVEMNILDREYARYTINEMCQMVYRMGITNPTFDDLDDYLKGSSFSRRWDAEDMCFYFERPLTSLDTAE